MFIEYGQGSSCGGASFSTVINGATQSDLPTESRTDITIPSGMCQGGSGCRRGFLYWTTLHGPFWQKSPGGTALTDPNYRGSFARVEVGPNGIFQGHVLSDTTGYTLAAAPGGSIEGIGYDEFKTSPPVISTCSATYYNTIDIDGTHTSTSTTLGVPNHYFEALTGYVGYVSQNTIGRSDYLQVRSLSSTVLSQRHALLTGPLYNGPMMGESLAGHCDNWDPPYVTGSRNVYSDSDVQLVAYPASTSARCFINGVTGAWSRTQDGSSTDEPYAQIYRDASNNVRLRVHPDSSAPIDTRVGAYASCVQL